MPLVTVRVNATEARKLNFGNQVISEVRQAMPYGAGNLAVDQARTSGASMPLTKRVYDVHTHAKAVIGESAAFKPRLMAGIASKYGAGNCDMAGSLAYTILRSRLSADYEVMLILNSAGGHTYAGFKEAGAPDSTAIIVDPWPTSGMATLAPHHFQGLGGTETVIRKPGKWDGVHAAEDRTALPAPKYADLITRMEQDVLDIRNGKEIPAAAYTSYNNDLCSSVVGRYEDHTGAQIPLPPERPMLPPPPIPDVEMTDMS